MIIEDDELRAIRYDLDKITTEISKFCRDRQHKYDIARMKWYLTYSEFITINNMIKLRELIIEQYRQDKIELNRIKGKLKALKEMYE